MPSSTPSTSVTRGVLPIELNSLAYAMARNECGEKLPLRDLLDGLGMDTTTVGLKEILRSASFRAKYTDYLRELKESGESFKLKARVQAEELLKTQWEIIHDKDAPASVRMQGIENVVEWADLKPKKTATDAPPPPAITIHIDLGGEKPEVIDVTPTPAALPAEHA